jgi:hypothetical protein
LPRSIRITGFLAECLSISVLNAYNAARSAVAILCSPRLLLLYIEKLLIYYKFIW